MLRCSLCFRTGQWPVVGLSVPSSMVRCADRLNLNRIDVRRTTRSTSPTRDMLNVNALKDICSFHIRIRSKLQKAYRSVKSIAKMETCQWDGIRSLPNRVFAIVLPASTQRTIRLDAIMPFVKIKEHSRTEHVNARCHGPMSTCVVRTRVELATELCLGCRPKQHLLFSAAAPLLRDHASRSLLSIAPRLSVAQTAI